MDGEHVESSDCSEDERIAIRDELKGLSMEELLQLKEKTGTKYYNSCVFKSPAGQSDRQNPSSRRNKQKYKRLNKNRPREESSKVPVRSVFQPTRKESLEPVGPRDPRFDSLCGQFNEWAYSKNYSFINDLRQKEVLKLENTLKKRKDPEVKSQISRALGRLKNQLNSRRVKDDKIKEKEESRRTNIELIKSGLKPRFTKKGDEKAMKLIDQYEELKSKGKLDKYMKKKNKELSTKSRSQLGFS